MSRIAGRINLYRIVRQIRQQPGISRQDIADNLHLDTSTISRLAGELCRAGLVRETPRDDSVGAAGGRKIQDLALNPAFGCVIGIELQSERVVAVLVDILGNVLASTSEAVTLPPEGMLAAIDGAIAGMKARITPASPLLGIGVGLPGLVDPARGMLLSSNPLSVEGPVELAAMLCEAQGVPVLVENDARCCCWGEILRGNVGASENFLFVLGEFRLANREPGAFRGPAIGMGFVFERSIYTGSESTAGEFKGILAADNDNGSQFAMRLAELGSVDRDDGQYRRLADELAIHISLFVNTLDLDEVVLGGPLFRRQEDLERAIRDRVSRNWLYRESPALCARRAFRVRFSDLEDRVVALGAASYVLERLFAVPRLVEEAAAGGPDIIQEAARRRHPAPSRQPAHRSAR